MKALFAGQKVWLWFGLDASCQERIWNVLHHNGAVLQDGDWTQEAHGDGEFLVVDNVERVCFSNFLSLRIAETFFVW
jgi:hypothetical protein